MAGGFPNATSPRMSYDKDGSVVVTYNNIDDTFTTISALNTAKLNSEDNVQAFTINPQSTASEFYLGVLFPEARSVGGIFICAVEPLVGADDQFMNITVEYSPDSTNFIDGTWYTAFSGLPFSVKTKTAYRYPYTLNISSATAIRIVDRTNSGNTGKIKNLHLYGSIIDDSTRIAFWDSTNNTALPPAYLDFGSNKLGLVFTKEIRLKNLSSTQTATNVRLSAEALTDAAPSNVSQFTFSYDNGVTFDTSIIIPSLSPGQISDKIIVKKSTYTNAALSVWSVRLLAEVIGTWS